MANQQLDFLNSSKSIASELRIMSFTLVISLLVCVSPALCRTSGGSGSGSGLNGQASWDGDPRYDLTWVEPHNKLYATEGQALSPSETLDLIKTLDEKYRIRRDEESVQKHKDIKTLLDISEPNEVKCRPPFKIFGVIDSEFSKNRIRPNIISFLDHYRDTQYSICFQTLYDNLKKDVDFFPDFYEQNLKQLVEDVGMGKGELNLEVGIAKFLSNKLPSSGGENLASNFNQEFHSLIGEPCEMLNRSRKNIEPFVSISRSMSKEKFDPFVRVWLENYNLCQEIVGKGSDQVRARSLSVLLSEKKELKHKDSKIDEKKSTPCFSCFRNKSGKD